MISGRNNPVGEEFSPRVEKIFALNRYLSRELLADLDRDDMKAFRRIASGRVPHVIRGNRVKAMMVMSQLGDARASKTLGRMIADENEDGDLRAVAALNLSLLRPKEAERVLISSLGIRDEVIRVNVIKSLGRVGSEGALEALDSVSGIKPGYMQKQLTFAKALISSRLELDRTDLRFVKGADRDLGRRKDAVGIAIAPMGKDELKGVFRTFEGSKYNVALSKDAGFKVECLGRTNFVILLNDRYKRELLSGIAARRAVFGLVARRCEATGTHSVQSAILTAPRDSATVEITVCRVDGEALYAGLGRIRGREMAFTLTDIERPGSVQRQVSGQVTDETVFFQEGYSLRKRRHKRRTRGLSARTMQR